MSTITTTLTAPAIFVGRFDDGTIFPVRLVPGDEVVVTAIVDTATISGGTVLVARPASGPGEGRSVPRSWVKRAPTLSV